MAAEPFSRDPAEIAARHERDRRQLILEYKATFAGTRGRKVLKDMQKFCGYLKPEATQGVSREEVYRRSAGKNLMFYIMDKVESTMQPKRKEPREES